MRWGLLSTGGISNDFALALKKTPRAELLAVASRSQEAADAFAKKHGFAKAYASYEALAVDPDVDIVYVATPNSCHCDNVLMCLGAGKHVLCEKPMVLNARHAEACIAKAKEKGVFLMEGMWTRFFPTTRAVRQLVQDGAIGRVISVTASLGFKSEASFNERLFRPELGGGALMDLGIYAALWISMILGLPKSVTAHASMHPLGVDMQTFCTFTYDSGAMAHLEVGFTGSMPNEVSIVGETGYIKVARPMQAPEAYTIVTRQGEESDPMLYRGRVQTVSTPLDPPHIGLAPGFNYVGAQGLRFQAHAVQEAVEQGKTEHPEMTLSETLANARMFDQIRSQIGLTYPWDEEEEEAAQGMSKRQRKQ